jgi:MATE family multidrug resistance protein
MLLLYIAAYFFMPRYAEYRNLWRTEHSKRKDIATMNHLGWPTGIQQGMEAAAFSLCAILLGWIGASALAAHQVMLNVAMTVYLFYIGIGSAVSIRVSNCLGLNDNAGIRRASSSGFQLIMLLGIITSSIVVMLRHHISGLFTDSDEVSAIVSTLVWPMMFYQFGDGTQTNFVNVLRGLGDVKPLMRYSFVAYIVISLPLSYLFGNVIGLGALGVWMGFPISLTTAAILYYTRYRKVMHRRETAVKQQA